MVSGTRGLLVSLWDLWAPKLMGKLGNTTSSVQPPINNQFSSTMNDKTGRFNSAVAGTEPLETASPEHQAAGKKRRASASVATQEDEGAIKRAKSKEAS